MGAAQSELSMDEILASIRRIIHEEEETKQPVRPTGENTVVLSDERAAQPLVDVPSEAELTIPEPASEEATVSTPAAQASPAVSEPAPEELPQEPQHEVRTLAPPPAPVQADAEPAAEEVEEAIDEGPLHPEQPFEAITPAKLTTKKVVTAAPAAEAPIEEPVTMPAVQAVEQPADFTDDVVESLIGDQQSQNVSAAFASLKQHVQVSQQGGRTLEDMVAQMIQPMLKAWLNENLPAIVERKVEEEVKRLSVR